ncbi:hypothetical protein AB0903_32780 [Streptomyces sp. NPDC048389]|uniref:hypothetical protein n=1 Tax=Streptomyces sp. NPDC048389 TaxID=3154622 RepID=UPI003451BE26
MTYEMALTHGIRAPLRNNGQAYGFPVSITGGLAMLNADARQPGTVHILYFALGAAAAFSLLEALVSAGFRKPLEEEPSTVTALGISLSFLSVTTAVALAWLTAHFVGGRLAWPITGFTVSMVYPLIAGVEPAVAQRARESSNTETGEEKDTEKQDDESDG